MPSEPAQSSPPQRTPALTPAQGVTAMEERLLRTVRLGVRYPELEALCKPQYEAFWVIGGRPGSYKTAIAWNLALNTAEEDQKVLVVSLEMSIPFLTLAALSKFSTVPRDRIEAHYVAKNRRLLGDDDLAKVTIAAEKYCALEKRLRIAGIETCGRNVRSILEEAGRVRYDAIFVDHLGMIGRDAGRELEVLSDAIDKLRGLAHGEYIKGYRPWVVATSQLSRDIDKSESERPPRMSDFRGSARIEHDTDVAIGLRKKKGEGVDDLEAHVLKNRFGPCPVVLRYGAYGATGLIVEAEEPQQEEESQPVPQQPQQEEFDVE